MSDQDFLSLIRNNRKARRAAARRSFPTFFSLYFSHYIKHQSAPFHQEMFQLLEDPSISLLAIIAFRGSGKSTIVSLAYILWAIMGNPQAKFVVLVGMTQEQVRQLLRNIRAELETNDLLRDDLGPFREEENEWRQTSLVLESYNARIMAISVDQSVRSLRHREHRPDLIVCDDVEDLQATTTRESRNKTNQWFTGELLPMGDVNTRTIVIGNLLHEDSLLRRIQRSIAAKELDGEHREFPLIDADGICLWPSKFKTPESIERERRRIGNEEAWQREYLLRILPDADQVILPKFIQYYDCIPADIERYYECTATAIDPAISQKSTADCTAMVSARVYYIDGHYHLYILPHPINERLTALETQEKAAYLSQTLDEGRRTRIYVEKVSYQQALVELLERAVTDVQGVSVSGQDKTARLKIASLAMQAGRVFFPLHGTETLVSQLLGFPRERFDDLVDAFSLLVNQVSLKPRAIFSAATIYDDGSVVGVGSLASCSCGPDIDYD